MSAATATAEEALELLKQTRRDLIARGREVARAIAIEKGSVNAREVRAAMIAEGSYQKTTCDRWLGAVFNRSMFAPVELIRADYSDVPSHDGAHIRRWALKAR
jgi:hypothetical protein